MPLLAQPSPRSTRRAWTPLIRAAVICAGLSGLVAASAVVTKTALHRASLEPLSALALEEKGAPQSSVEAPAPVSGVESGSRAAAGTDVPVAADAPLPFNVTIADAEINEPEPAPATDPNLHDPSLRWFNGRPVRPARTMTMLVTAYSPDARSCGADADGITSSIHNVYTNAMKLVAADTRLLPLGSMVSVPGYDNDNVVPVLDRGGAIKGHRLDVLFPTHEIAMKWGVQRLKVTVWEFADGLPPDDYRKVRDSRD